MWRKQIRANRAAEEADRMVAKAKALQEAALERPGSSGNEGGPSEDVSENEAESRALKLASKAHIRNEESLLDGASSITHVDDAVLDDRADLARDQGGSEDRMSDDGAAGNASATKAKDVN